MKNKDSFRTFLCRQVPTITVLIIALIALLLIPVQVPLSKTAQGSQLGPRFIPAVILSGAVFFCLLSFLSEAYTYFCKKGSFESFPLATLRQYGKVALLIAALLIWYVLLKSIGFIIMTALLMATSMFLLGNRHTWQIILIPLVVSTGIYLLFSSLLNVPLPSGILPL